MEIIYRRILIIFKNKIFNKANFSRLKKKKILYCKVQIIKSNSELNNRNNYSKKKIEVQYNQYLQSTMKQKNKRVRNKKKIKK